MHSFGLVMDAWDLRTSARQLKKLQVGAFTFTSILAYEGKSSWVVIFASIMVSSEEPG